LQFIQTHQKPFNGVYKKPEKPALTIKGVFKGQYQTNFEKWFADRMPLRLTMTYMYNQLLYSIFRSTDNKNIIIGKNNFLYEPWYPLSFLMEFDDQQTVKLKQKMDILLELQKNIEKLDKAFLVLLTPSKASIYPDYLPAAYRPYVKMKENGEYLPNAYEIFLAYANEIGLSYLGEHEMFKTMREKGVDVFVEGGTHWTEYAAVPYINEMSKVLGKQLNKTIGTLEIATEKRLFGSPFHEDGDLAKTLNLVKSPFDFLSTHITTQTYNTEFRPSFFVIGGSFNWGWQSAVFDIVESGETIFSGADFSWHNAQITKMPERSLIAQETDDFAFISIYMEKDIVLIECNYQNIRPNAPVFIFAENLLNYLKSLEDTSGEAE
jgi:hypothetical protein